MPFTRPSCIPYPATWHTFKATSRSGREYTMSIRDLTEDMYEDALEVMVKHFTADEPPCKYIEINKHPTAVAHLTSLWKKCLQQRMSVACVAEGAGRDGGPLIVGVNILSVALKDDEDEVFQTDDPIWSQLFGAVDIVSRGVDIFNTYGVEAYLAAYGLVVVPVYRGMRLGIEILKARIPICKALNIKITATVFTAAASQVAAEKAGFVTVFQMSYDDLAARGCVFPNIQESTMYSKLMVMQIE